MHDIPEIDANGLKRFALTTGGIVIVLFGILLPWLFGIKTSYWPWLLGLSLLLSGIFTPGSLRPVYRVWMHFGLIMHRITTPIILGVMFFLVITPTGFLMRIFSHNSMPLNADKENTTYRIISRARKKEDMEKPF